MSCLRERKKKRKPLARKCLLVTCVVISGSGDALKESAKERKTKCRGNRVQTLPCNQATMAWHQCDLHFIYYSFAPAPKNVVLCLVPGDRHAFCSRSTMFSCKATVFLHLSFCSSLLLQTNYILVILSLDVSLMLTFLLIKSPSTASLPTEIWSITSSTTQLKPFSS